MKRHWKKIAIAIGALVVLVVGGSFIYAKVINKADPEFGQSDVNAKLDAATTTIGPSSTANVGYFDDSRARCGHVRRDGAAVISRLVSYRPDFRRWDLDHQGRLRGRLSCQGDHQRLRYHRQRPDRSRSPDRWLRLGRPSPQVSSPSTWTTFKSDEGGRDEQFKERVMDVAKFPTSTFVLTAPIDFGAIPPDGGTVNATATGDLTLHGTTKSVTFNVQGTFKNGLIGVLGQIPVVFADWEIPAPSIGSIRTEDNGLLEFVLVLQHA